MAQEDKQLLLKDLSARLPYKVKLRYFGKIPNYFIRKLTEDDLNLTLNVDNFSYIEKTIVYYKPYLRPMCSITKDEIEELKELCSIYIPTDSPIIGFEDYGIIVFTHHLTNNTYSFKLDISVIDWLNKKMFDYRGLIEKGLAVAVTEDNNPYKD